MGDDAITRHRNVITAGGAKVHDDRHDRNFALLLKSHDLMINNVRGRDRPAGTIDPQEERLDTIVLGRERQFLFDARYKVIVAVPHRPVLPFGDDP